MGTLEGSWRVITLRGRWAHKLIFKGLQGASTSIPDPHKRGTLALFFPGLQSEACFFFFFFNWEREGEIDLLFIG